MADMALSFADHGAWWSMDDPGAPPFRIARH